MSDGWRDHPLAPLPLHPPLVIQQRGLTVIICLVLALLKLNYNDAVSFFGIDGSYYFEVARHVRDGHGLSSMVSLYHQGFSTFPHPTPIYPLWPLLLGLAGRVVDLQWAAVWLPTLFYFVVLAALYNLTLKVWAEPLFPQVWPVFHSGHFALVFLGLNERFFRHTSQPYTEGLAFTLLLFGLMRARTWLSLGGVWRALEVGVWFGLTFLARSQMVVALLALVMTLGWTVFWSPSRSKSLAEAAAVVLGIILPIVPHYFHLATYIPDLSYRHFIHFERYQETPELSRVIMSVQTDGWWSWIVDRSRGLWIGFRPSGKFTYFHIFYTYYLAIPVALVMLGVEVWHLRAQGRWAEMKDWVTSPRNFYLVLIGLLAMGGFWSLHTIHKPVFLTWNFGSRHALSGFFLVMIAVLYLTRAPTLGKVWALLIVCVGIHASGKVLVEDITRMEKDQARKGSASRGTTPHERVGDEAQGITSGHLELRAWIQEQQLQDPQLVLAMPDPQPVARYTTDVAYHWISDVTTLRDLNILTSRLGVDYVLLPRGSVRYWNVSAPHIFYQHFGRTAEDISGYDVYRRRFQ